MAGPVPPIEPSLWYRIVGQLDEPLSGIWAGVVAGAGVTLAVVAFQQARKREWRDAVGFGIAAVGSLLWALLRGPTYYLLVIPGIAILVPWLVWSSRARAWRTAIAARSGIVVDIHRRVREPDLPETDRGLLDYEFDGTKATLAMGRVLNDMTKVMEKQNKELPRHARRSERVREASAGRRRRVAGRAARGLARHAADLERLEVRFRAEIDQMTSNIGPWVRGQSRAEADAFRSHLRDLGRITKEGRQNTEGYRKAVQGLRTINIAQTVNRASVRLQDVLAKIIEDERVVERFAVQQGRNR